jgi:hypothetical protein
LPITALLAVDRKKACEFWSHSASFVSNPLVL